MTLGFDFHPEARAEFVADVDWYDNREAGIGARFEGAVREAIDAAADSPESWSAWPDWERQPVVRSKGVNGFPLLTATLGEDVGVMVGDSVGGRRACLVGVL